MQRKIEIGDVLIVAVIQENREWGYSPAPDGIRLKVTGFRTRYIGRSGEFGRKPGEYVFNDVPIVVREDNYAPVEIGSFHMRFEDDSTIEHDMDGVWIGKLPELTFWEGDIVRADRELCGSHEVVIARISYGDIHTLCTDGVTPYPIYTIAPNMSAGISTAARESDLSLVCRGNIWKYYHSEPLEFESVAAEAISVTPGLFGAKQRPNVKTFLDREVGERVREETLRGWADFNPEKFKDEIAEELQHRKDMDALRATAAG
jgi:hypothetical protein